MHICNILMPFCKWYYLSYNNRQPSKRKREFPEIQVAIEFHLRSKGLSCLLSTFTRFTFFVGLTNTYRSFTSTLNQHLRNRIRMFTVYGDNPLL